MDYDIYELGDVTLQSGEVLADAKLAYKTHGTLNAARDNAIVMPTFYTGSHARNEGYIEACPARASWPLSVDSQGLCEGTARWS